MTKTDIRAVEHSVRHGGGSLYVLDHPGEEPAIVAMHGFPDDVRIYDRLTPHLSPRRVVVFDWLGYGRSDRRARPGFTGSDRQRDLVAVLDGLDLERVTLVGHDASGPEAIELALGQPDRIDAVVLLNTYYGRDESMHLPELIALMADPEFKPLTDALLDDEAQRLWLLMHTAGRFGIPRDAPDTIGTVSILPQFFGGAGSPNALDEIRAWTADLPHALDHQDNQIRAGKLAALDIPVRVIFGREDTFLNPHVARHLSGRFARSELHLVPGASHWPQWDQPEIVADLIARPV